MGNSVRFVSDGNFQRWLSSFSDLSRAAVTPAAEKEWRLANEVFFQFTQSYVHVISSDLKGSGRMETSISGAQIDAEITYGGTMGSRGRLVDYAQHELARGGSHDYIRRGYLKSEKILQDGIGKSLMAMMNDAFGG